MIETYCPECLYEKDISEKCPACGKARLVCSKRHAARAPAGGVDRADLLRMLRWSLNFLESYWDIGEFEGAGSLREPLDELMQEIRAALSTEQPQKEGENRA